MSETTTYQVILSTDGKHTVIGTTDRADQVDNVQAWAMATYEHFVKRYGLKGEHKANGNGNGNGSEETPTCAIHKVPMGRVEGRKGPFWSCHQKMEDGSWCSYKPSRE